MSAPVSIIATLIPLPENIEKLRDLLIKLVKWVEVEEPDCLGYQIIESSTAEHKCVFKILEQWKSQEVLDKHTAKPFIIECEALCENEKWLVEPEGIERVSVIAGFGARTK